MTFIFCLLCIITVALTYNVIYPRFHHPKWIVPSFIAGWLVGELALHVVAVSVLVTFLFAWVGAIQGFWGALALLLMVTSWLVLAYHYFSGYKAKVIMESIVAPHRTDDQSTAWTRHAELDGSRLLRPFEDFKTNQIGLTKNVVYAEEDGLKLKLDIRRNLSHPQNAPVLLQIHGGGWTHGYGSKNEQGVPLCVEMARRGWVTVSISYRLSPKYKLPTHLIDCKKALTWIKHNIAEYGGDPKFVVTTGGSAGGHLCSLLALTPNEQRFQPGFEDEDTTVQGCVPFYGIYDFLDRQQHQLSPGISIVLRKQIIGQTKTEAEALYADLSPLSHINENAPPFLLIHGDKDSLTSLSEAQYFASELDQVSKASVEFAEIAGAQHAFDVFTSLRSDYVIQGIAERLEQWHGDYLSKS